MRKQYTTKLPQLSLQCPLSSSARTVMRTMYLKNFVSVYPKEVLATVLAENPRRFSRENLARV